MSRLTALTLVLLVSLRHDRDVSTSLSTCGFLNGDPSKPWVAPNGFDCRVDTLHGIWGFCPTTVISATDCGLGAFCFDSGPCSTGCGRASLRDNTQVTTWTCPDLAAGDTPDQTMCSTATLIFGPDQSYDYVDCARTASKATYFVSPRDAVASTTSSQSSTTQTKQLSTSVPTPLPILSSSLSSTSLSAPLSTATSASSASGTTLSGSIVMGTGSASQTAQTQGSGNSTGSTGSTGSTNNTAAIIGGAVGGLALIVGGVIAVVYILRRHNSAPRGSDKSHKDRSSSPDADIKYPEAGWGPAELASAGRTPAELPGYWPSLAPVQSPVELPAGYGR